MKLSPEFVFQNSICFDCFNLCKEIEGGIIVSYICKDQHPTILHMSPLVKVDHMQTEVKAVVTHSDSGTHNDQNGKKKETVIVNTGSVINAKDSYGRLSIIRVSIKLNLQINTGERLSVVPNYKMINNTNTKKLLDSINCDQLIYDICMEEMHDRFPAQLVMSHLKYSTYNKASIKKTLLISNCLLQMIGDIN